MTDSDYFELLGLSRRSAYRLIEEGRLRPVRPTPGGRFHAIDTYASWNPTDKITLGGEFDYVSLVGNLLQVGAAVRATPRQVGVVPRQQVHDVVGHQRRRRSRD